MVLRVAMMFEPGGGDEDKHDENYDALFGWRKNKESEEPSHFVA
jgi:hypothetical protein